MAQEISNLDKLTEKIYKEGLEKAQQRSEELIKEAEAQKKQIIQTAHQEAEQITNSAKKTAALELKSAESEIRLKGKQLVSDLKSEINHLLKLKVLEENVKTSFSDQDFLQSLILEIVTYWKSEGELELILPEKLRGKVDKAFEKNIAEKVNNLTISFNDRLANGFRVSRKADSYDITFSENDFVELFGGYLKEKTNKFLFTEES